MKDVIFKGCGTALVTPFTDDGEVDFETLRKLIDFQILEGVDSLIICGTTGESATLSTEEKKEIIKFAVQIARRRVPIIAGTGSNNTKTSIELSKYAQSVGANGLLIVSPYYNKTTKAGLIKHYGSIAQSVDIPIILYNVPSRTGLNIEPSTCLELSKLKNIVAIKEASSNISQIAQIAHLCKDNLHIYSGNDDQVIPILSLGGIGVISVLSNLYPKYVHNMVYNYLDGNLSKALNMQLDSLDLIHSLFCEVSPIPVKYAMAHVGLSCGKTRLPLVEPSKENKERILNSLKSFQNATR